jgi:hypothetical protein
MNTEQNQINNNDNNNNINNNNNNNNNIQQIKIENLRNSFNFINNAINRCVTKGQFTLDEAYITKLNLNNIYLGIDTLEKYQNLLIDALNKEKNN